MGHDTSIASERTAGFMTSRRIEIGRTDPTSLFTFFFFFGAFQCISHTVYGLPVRRVSPIPVAAAAASSDSRGSGGGKSEVLVLLREKGADHVNNGYLAMNNRR